MQNRAWLRQYVDAETGRHVAGGILMTPRNESYICYFFPKSLLTDTPCEGTDTGSSHL